MKLSHAKRFLFAAAVYGLTAIVQTGCNYNKQHDATKPASMSDALKAVDYSVVQSSVIGPKCLSCHSNASGNQGGVNLEGLKNLRSYLSRVGYRALETRDMPPSGLGERDAAILRTWIEAGAPESLIQATEAGDPALEMGPTNWPKISERIFAGKCLDCHIGKEPHGGLDLSTFEATRDKATAIFDRVFVKQDMPIAPYPMLTPRERRVMLKWFELGMPK